MQSAVPYGHNEVLGFNREGTGEVDCVSAAQDAASGQVTSTAFHVAGEFHRPESGPELCPVPSRRGEPVLIEVVIPMGGRERSTDLRVGEAA